MTSSFLFRRLVRAARALGHTPRAVGNVGAFGHPALVGLSAVAVLGAVGCTKPEPLAGTYTATCTFKGAYRGGGRADSSWTRQCTITLEARSESEVAMRFDSGDAIECYGHAAVTGSGGERKVGFPKNDLTCRAKNLPAPAGILVEQCPMPGTFDLEESVDNKKKTTLAVKLALDVADKRACVFAYLEKVSVEGKLVVGGAPVSLEVFRDAGAPVAIPTHEAPPPFPGIPRHLGDAGTHGPHDAASSLDAGTHAPYDAATK